MFFAASGIKLIKIFMGPSGSSPPSFQRFAALAEQFNQSSQLQAVTGIDICLLNVPLKVRSLHILAASELI